MHHVWQKRWKNIAWVGFAAITLLLLGAGVYKKNHKLCTGIEVVFDGDGNNFFTDEKEVAARLKANGAEEGIAIDKINLRLLEEKLKNDLWIAKAELFFDNKQVLKAIIKEKEPVARMFTGDGSSFYIDSACRRLPLSQKLSARIPMFTGFPSDKVVLSKPDSALLADAKELAVFIQSDEFWKAQVAQVDITAEGFEMIPTIGSHVVALGRDGNYQQKFDRLYSFYKQVWTKVGFETYEKLDVRFNGQVVATVKGARATAIVDSAKALAALKSLVEKDKPDTAEEDDEEEDIHTPVKDTAATVSIQAGIIKPKPPAAKSAIAATAAALPKPQAVMARLNRSTHLPKADNKKTAVKKGNIKQPLSADEEKIRREALKQSLKNGLKPKPKQKPKAILKKI